jgi:hypothetical protein
MSVTEQGPQQAARTEVRITVNDQFVVLAHHEVTGLEIKEAAIAVGVAIQLDFVLSEVLPNGEQRIIPDDRHLGVKTGDQFWAIPGDDNS